MRGRCVGQTLPSSQGGLSSQSHTPKLNTHIVQRINQAVDVRSAQAETVEQEAPLRTHEGCEKQESPFQQGFGEVRSVLRGVGHPEADGSFESPEISADALQVATEDLDPFAAQAPGDIRTVALLPGQVPLILLREKTLHRPVSRDGEPGQPFCAHQFASAGRDQSME
jgi:hypothetical protein